MAALRARKTLMLSAAITLLAISNVVAQGSTILIPTLYSGPGAFGSTWWSGVAINNYSSADFSSPGVQFGVLCPIPEGCTSDTLPAGEVGDIVGPRAAAGLLLHGESEVLSLLAFQGRFGQQSFNFTDGTELPIVRENAFVRTPIRLPNVTLYGTRVSVRSTLRIYGPDAEPGTRVRVEIRSSLSLSGQPLASKTVQLGVPSQPTQSPVFPAYAQLSLQQEFPFEHLLGSSFNITVIPLPFASGSIPRIWAFISTTENVSQQVSVQTPQ
jgi:hypothetical protein